MKKIEAIIQRSKAKGYENFLQECEQCMERDCCDTCSFFEVTGHYACEVNACLEELNEEYLGITEKEYHLLKYLETGWIARDEDGSLGWYTNKPYREYSFDNGDVFAEVNSWNTDFYGGYSLEAHLFPFITWETDAFKVEDLLLLPVKNNKS